MAVVVELKQGGNRKFNQSDGLTVDQSGFLHVIKKPREAEGESIVQNEKRQMVVHSDAIFFPDTWKFAYVDERGLTSTPEV
jgi:hypothetical protein